MHDTYMRLWSLKGCLLLPPCLGCLLLALPLFIALHPPSYLLIPYPLFYIPLLSATLYRLATLYLPAATLSPSHYYYYYYYNRSPILSMSQDSRAPLSAH